MIDCPYCGAKNPAAARFCGQCLQLFAQPASPPYEQHPLSAPGYSPAPTHAPYPNTPPPSQYQPVGAYSRPYPGQSPRSNGKNEWLPIIVVAIIAAVLIVGSGGIYLLTRQSPGGRAQLSSLAMTIDYPRGWQDRTADRSFTNDVGCSSADLAQLPDARCDVVLSKADDSILLVISFRPSSAVTDADLQDAIAAAAKGSTVAEQVEATRIAGLTAYRAVIEGTTTGGVFRRSEPYTSIIAVFQTNTRVAFLGAGSKKEKFGRDRPQLEEMISSLRSAI
jgi:hypothetical protein